ncbi:hypothetical protein BCR37DRAFT_376007 [Protomyces lactucae-debilis]|uniref:Uncharacterized protein n=1 Tax=Protomyces lactucae-debilis TaxID=2754530 RepID=A0A1Y2FT50_PROLT|nr:uncharacterized protein BCR37DRAFT_376007 [Protomyces lactucae-debilis]ORY86767.1 hypothetical protein BCR37DRAFT_376007 [Protomyces lactucae-debilis]
MQAALISCVTPTIATGNWTWARAREAISRSTQPRSQISRGTTGSPIQQSQVQALGTLPFRGDPRRRLRYRCPSSLRSGASLHGCSCVSSFSEKSSGSRFTLVKGQVRLHSGTPLREHYIIQLHLAVETKLQAYVRPKSCKNHFWNRQADCVVFAVNHGGRAHVVSRQQWPVEFAQYNRVKGQQP